MKFLIVDEEHNCGTFWNAVNIIAHAGGKGTSLFRFLLTLQPAEEFPITEEDYERLTAVPGWDEGPFAEVAK
jgi:hypothetical protein